jgi:hypothetical protein
MGGDIFLIGVVLLPMLCARVVAGKRYTDHLFGLTCFAGIMFLLMLLLFNDTFPFAGGGDDEVYFDASNQSFNSLGDWFDMTRYDRHDQTGYPFLLSWVHQFSGNSLYHLKALNIFFLLEIALVWFAIGQVIGGRRLGFIYAYGMLLTTPLWYYWLFLLKDMSITLLQSIFLFGLILFVSGEHRFRSYVVIALSTVAVIPFRSALAASNVALLIICMFLQRRSRLSGDRFGTRLALVASLVLGLWLFSSQPGMMETLGAKGEHRSLTAEAIVEQVEHFEADRKTYGYSLVNFTFLYLVGETDALNPANWGRFDLEILRPLSMVPWIFIGLPFFFAGVATIVRRIHAWKLFASGVQHNDAPGKGEDLRRRQIRFLMVLLAFIVVYGGLGWLTGTTVRWTLPAIPPMVGIAGFAWANMNREARLRRLTVFNLSLLTLILTYYLGLNRQ